MKSITKLTALMLLLLSISYISCKNATPTDQAAVVEELPADTKAVQIKGEEISYRAGDVEMKGYIAYDEALSGKRPGIIVVHEWWGHNDYVRKRADMLAELGYTAIAIDMYGDGKQAAHPDDAGKFSMMVMSNIDEAKERFVAAMDVLQNHETVDSTQLAAVGYCFGGSVALTMADAGMPLDAVAAFHSGVDLPIMPGKNLKAKVLVCNGADDPFISPESVEAFKDSLKAVKAQYEYISYKGAVHAFTSMDADELGKKFDLPLAYNKEADEKSWQELKDLLSSTF